MNYSDSANSSDCFLIGSFIDEESYLRASSFCVSGNTTPFMNKSANISDEQANVYRQLNLVYQIIPKVLVIPGTIGNVLALIVFVWSKRLRKTAFAQFMVALAVTDTLLLWLHVLYTLTASRDLEIRSSEICRMLVWLTDTVTYVSSWLIVAVTFDRLIAIALPLQTSTWCHKRVAWIAVFVIVSVFSVFSIYNFWGWEAIHVAETYWMCKQENKNIRKSRTIIFVAVFSLLPSLLLFGMNGIIMKNLSNALAKQKTYRASFNKQRAKMIQRQLDVLLLTVSFSFLVLTLPMTIVNIVIFSKYDDNSKVPRDDNFAKLYTCREILNIVSFANNCLIFPQYCVSGRKFREELKTLFCHIKGKLTESVKRNPPPDHV